MTIRTLENASHIVSYGDNNKVWHKHQTISLSCWFFFDKSGHSLEENSKRASMTWSVGMERNRTRRSQPKKNTSDTDKVSTTTGRPHSWFSAFATSDFLRQTLPLNNSSPPSLFLSFCLLEMCPSYRDPIDAGSFRGRSDPDAPPFPPWTL